MLFGHTSLCNKIMRFLLTDLPSLCMLLCRCDMSGMLLKQYFLEEVIKTTWLLADPQAGPRQLETLYPHSAHHSHVVVIQSLSRVQLFVIPWTSARQAFLSFTISQSLLKLMSIQSVIPSIRLSSAVPFSSCLQSFPHQSLFQWVGSSHQVQFSSVGQSCPTLGNSMNCNTPGLPVHHQLPESTQMHVHRVGDAIQPSHPLSSPSAPALNFSQHQVFSNESALRIRWPQYWSFSISPSNEHSGLISFGMDWLDLLVVQETFKSLLQHHSLKASILQCSAFLMVQLSHWYVTTGKTIALTKWTFVSKVMSWPFNMLFRFFIAVLPRNRPLLILWLHHHLQWFWGSRK